MARFSNRIQDVKFVDQQEKTIEVLYKADDDSTYQYYVEVNYSSQDFLDLSEEWTIENIQDRTAEFYNSLNMSKNLVIETRARELFDSWVANAQSELDIQDEQRYHIFEEYKQQQLKLLQQEVDSQVESRYEEVDSYKQEQLKVLQAEIDKQVESRYEEVNEYKKEQLKVLQAEIDQQVESRYEEVDGYKQKQLKLLQQEVDQQVESRYEEVDEYKQEQLKVLQNEIDQQVTARYEEADEYKQQQLKVLQDEIDRQVESRYEEVNAYREAQVDQVKAEMYKKFNMEAPKATPVTPKNVANFIINNFEDEDTVFKTKLAIFDLPEVKNSENREMKMKVRKAKSIPELFAAYNDIQHSNS